MSLSNLLAEMTAFQTQPSQTLAKAAPPPPPPPPADPDGKQDDQAIQAAAAAANADNAKQEPGGAGAGGDGANAATDGAGQAAAQDTGAMVKSFSFELEDGERVDAYDATALIKSMNAELTALRTDSVGVMKQAFDLIKSQAGEIASLKKQVEALGLAGRGRKAVVSIAEKVAAPQQTLAKSSNAGMSVNEFFAKAQAAQSAGRITAQDVAVAETYLNKGMPVPDRIVSRVIGG